MRAPSVLGQPFDFRSGLPRQLVLAKPVEQGNYNPALLLGQPGESALISTRKWNGWRLIATFVPGVSGRDEQIIRLYRDGIDASRNRRRADLHLPHIVSDLRDLQVPPWTVLSTEVVVERNGEERLGAVSSILNLENPSEAVALQDRVGRAKLLLHGALCWHDEWLAETPYDDVLSRLIGLASPKRKDGWVRSVAIEAGTITDAQRRVRENGWEGLVVTRHDYRFTWRMNRPDSENPRPVGSFKWKPQETGDFIADRPRMSTLRDGRLKDVMLVQIAPDGRRFLCGRVGNFNARVDAQLQSRGFPLVLEVRFDGRTPAGKLVSPCFIRIRDDKRETQCVSGKVFPEIQYA